MALSLKVLGEFVVRDAAGRKLSLPTRKTRALLAYLAVHAGQPQLRERLMALLWSDREDRQARQSLNQALRSIRRLGDEAGVTLLDGDVEHVTLTGDALESDVVRFRALLADEPAEAIKLYEGPFLDGLSIPDPAFEEWLTSMRGELHSAVCDGLRRAADAAAEAGNADQAIAMAQRLVSLDPLHEDAHRRLMHLLHQSGDRAGALRQYQACAEILQRELQVEPDAATKALFETIRRDGSTLEAETQPPTVDQTPSRVPEELALATTKTVSKPTPRPSKLLTAVAAATVFLVVGGVTLWLVPWSAPNEPAPEQGPSLPLPDKPSIAVLPFTNLSGDPEQEYFSDGMTDDLITDLSKVSGLFVIARNSSFAYKGRTQNLRKVGRELGVKYVVEGSVRRAGTTVRINAQLIDAATGGHLWAERFDGALSDVFGLQDRVNQKIVTALAVTLTTDDRSRLRKKKRVNPDAYDAFLRGLDLLQHFNPEDNAQAREWFKKAIALDSGYARAYANVARTYSIEINFHWTAQREETIRLGLKYAAQALALDDSIPQVYQAQASIFLSNRRYEAAIAAARRTVEVDPNSAVGHGMLAFVLYHAGELKPALNTIRTAKRLDPKSTHIRLFVEGQILFLMGRYAAAAPILEEAIRRNLVVDRVHLLLAATYAQMGEMENATWAIEEALAIRPGLSLDDERRDALYRRPEDRNRYIEGLRKAGFPE